MKAIVENNQGNVVLLLQGRLDTAATQMVTAEIESQLASCSEVKSLTCDASDLSYISSSGLRILLGLAKRYKDFRVVEVSQEVWPVFEMTGFVKIMHINIIKFLDVMKNKETFKSLKEYLDATAERYKYGKEDFA